MFGENIPHKITNPANAESYPDMDEFMELFNTEQALFWGFTGMYIHNQVIKCRIDNSN